MATPTPTLNRNDYPEYTEKHTIVLSESEIVSMDGQLLRETKQLTTVTSDDPAAPEQRLYKEHTRTIGEREYQIREVRYDGVIHKVDENTELTEEEIAQFMDDWSLHWTPVCEDADATVVHYSYIIKFRECDILHK